MKAIGSVKQEIEQTQDTNDAKTNTENQANASLYSDAAVTDRSGNAIDKTATKGKDTVHPEDIYYICGAGEFDRKFGNDKQTEYNPLGKGPAIQPEYGFDTDSPHVALDTTWAKDVRTIVRSLTGGSPELVEGLINGKHQTKELIEQKLVDTNTRLYLAEHGLAESAPKPTLEASKEEAADLWMNLRSALEEEDKATRANEQRLLDAEMSM